MEEWKRGLDGNEPDWEEVARRLRRLIDKLGSENLKLRFNCEGPRC